MRRAHIWLARAVAIMAATACGSSQGAAPDSSTGSTPVATAPASSAVDAPATTPAVSVLTTTPVAAPTTGSPPSTTPAATVPVVPSVPRPEPTVVCRHLDVTGQGLREPFPWAVIVGEHARLVQQRLIDLGYGQPIIDAGGVDGILRQPTVDALVAWTLDNLPRTQWSEIWGEVPAEGPPGSGISMGIFFELGIPCSMGYLEPTSGVACAPIAFEPRAAGLGVAGSGDVVRLYQERLIELGWGQAIVDAGGPDGHFGQVTDDATDVLLSNVWPAGDHDDDGGWFLSATTLTSIGVDCELDPNVVGLYPDV